MPMSLKPLGNAARTQASTLMRTTFWKPSGMKVALGNRDDVPEPPPLAARADRAAKNMLENLLLFCCLILAARLANAPQERVVLGARIFFCALLTLCLFDWSITREHQRADAATTRLPLL